MGKGSAMRFDELDGGWKAAFEGAWEAYLSGTVPIGAAIQDEAGNVVARGRNRIYDAQPAQGVLQGNGLAHAEINAILALDEREHPHIRRYTLTTTMEPCPLCFGAIVMGNLRHFRYGARDAWAGAAALTQSHAYIRSKQILAEGPVEGLEAVQIALHACFELEAHPDKCAALLERWEHDCRAGVMAGRLLHAGGILRSWREEGADARTFFDAVSTLCRNAEV